MRIIFKENKNRQGVKRKVNENEKKRKKTVLTYFIVQITENLYNQLDCLQVPCYCLLVPRNEPLSEGLPLSTDESDGGCF